MKVRAKKDKKTAAADAFIIVLLLICIAALGVRIALGSGDLLSSDGSGEYLVSYTVSGIKGEYSELFSEGKEFYLEDGERLGELRSGAVFTPAKTYTENSEGELKVTYATDGTVDVKGAALVRGAMTESGFLLGGNRYIAANMPLSVSSTDITVTITVTDIIPAQ